MLCDHAIDLFLIVVYFGITEGIGLLRPIMREDGRAQFLNMTVRNRELAITRQLAPGGS